jgi:hypothetical protein
MSPGKAAYMRRGPRLQKNSRTYKLNLNGYIYTQVFEIAGQPAPISPPYGVCCN